MSQSTLADCSIPPSIFPSSFYSIEAKPDKKSPPITYKIDNPKLRDMRHILLDVYRRRWALAVDVDKPPEEWLSHLHSFRTMYPELTPSWAFHSLTTGHAHMVWTIDPVTTGSKARTAPQHFAQDIQASLAHIFGADTGYKAHMTYNPLYKRYLLVDYSRGDNLRLQSNLRAGEDEGVIHVFDPDYLQPRTLGQLYKGLTSSDLWEDSSEARRKAPKKGQRVSIPRRDVIHKGERNIAIFEEARLDPRDPFIVAHEINDSGRVQPPLRHSEVDGIARSIQGYRAKKGHKKTSGGGLILSDQQRATLSQWGHKGGSRNTEAQKEARKLATPAASIVRSAEAVGRRAQIRELKANGYTHKKIMDKLGVSKSTVKRALRD